MHTIYHIQGSYFKCSSGGTKGEKLHAVLKAVRWKGWAIEAMAKGNLRGPSSSSPSDQMVLGIARQGGWTRQPVAKDTQN
jgi:hypothetical protein